MAELKHTCGSRYSVTRHACIACDLETVRDHVSEFPRTPNSYTSSALDRIAARIAELTLQYSGRDAGTPVEENPVLTPCASSEEADTPDSPLGRPVGNVVNPRCSPDGTPHCTPASDLNSMSRDDLVRELGEEVQTRAEMSRDIAAAEASSARWKDECLSLRTRIAELEQQVKRLDLCTCSRSNGRLGNACLDCKKPVVRMP